MPSETKSELIEIAYRFYENLFALRIFNEQIGQLAENYDQTTKGKFFSGLAGLAGLSDGAIDTTGDTPFELRLKHKRQLPAPLYIEPSTDESETPETKSVEFSQPVDDDKNIVEVDIDDEQQFSQIVSFLRSAKNYSPRQSKLLRQGALITLISYFESLESDLLNYYYLKYPAALPSEGKLLSLADLREIGSIDEAEKFLILKEIDDFLRERNTEEQIDYFIKKFKVDMKSVTPYINSLVEVNLRRNLFVHNNGVVNKIYLKKADKDIVRKTNIKEGDKLEIDGDYLSFAIDIICVVGTILIQQSWRKWDEKSTETANKVLREYTYDLLTEKRWELVNKISEYASTIQFTSDVDSRIIKINQAIALKEQDKTSEMVALLDKLDWSSCSLKFHAANFALKEQYDRMLPVLAKAISAGEIDQNDMREFPLFKWFRESKYYQSFCNQVFALNNG